MKEYLIYEFKPCPFCGNKRQPKEHTFEEILHSLYETSMGAVTHVAIANYNEREREAKMAIKNEYEKALAAINKLKE